ncbi:MAG: flippase [Candidatus Pacebacteria bacterium]|nr:flippase [Candidatus Paceibacterota bacterium]
MNLKSILLDNKTTKQTIFKNTFWLMLAEGISKGLMFFLTILIARYLGAEGYGIFSFAFAFVALFAVLADFGLSTLTIREVAREKSLARKYIDNIATIKLILGIITFGLIVGIIQFLEKTPEVKTLVYLAGICVIIQSFTEFFQSIFRAFEKMQYEALSKIIYSLLLFSIAGFILWKNLGIKLLVYSYIIAAIIALIFTLILVRKKFTKFRVEIDFEFWKKLLKESWPFTLTLIFAVIYFKIDIVMLSFMKNDTAVGLYSAAKNTLVGLGIITFIICATVYPIFSKYYVKSKDRLYSFFKKVWGYSIAFNVILISFLYPITPLIIKTLYGAEFISSVSVMYIFLFTYLLTFSNTLINYLINASNQQRLAIKPICISLLINIFLNALLIPRYSYNGAALATLLSDLFITCFFFNIIKRKIFI